MRIVVKLLMNIFTALALYWVVVVSISTHYLHESTTEYNLSSMYYRSNDGNSALVHRKLGEASQQKAINTLLWLPSFLRPKM